MALGAPHLARLAGLRRRVSDLVEVRGERLGDRVRGEVDPEALDVEPRRGPPRHQRLGVVELLALDHQALPEAPQVSVGGLGALLRGGLHGLAGRIGGDDRAPGPEPRVDRHPASRRRRPANGPSDPRSSPRRSRSGPPRRDNRGHTLGPALPSPRRSGADRRTPTSAAAASARCPRTTSRPDRCSSEPLRAWRMHGWRPVEPRAWGECRKYSRMADEATTGLAGQPDRDGSVRSLPARVEARQRRDVDGVPGPRRDPRAVGRGQGHAPRDLRPARPDRALPARGPRGRAALAPQRRRRDRRRRGRRLSVHRPRVRRGRDPEAADRPAGPPAGRRGRRLRDRDRARARRRARPPAWSTATSSRRTS